MQMSIVVVGAGAWGTAIAVQAARCGHSVQLWARDAAQAEALVQTRCNARYLPGVVLPPGVEPIAPGRPLSVVLAALRGAAAPVLVLVATPMAALRGVLAELPADCDVAALCKGFEAGSQALGHEVAAAVRPGRPWAVLSGPSFADEVAAGQPTALVAASSDAALTSRVTGAVHGGALRVYASADPVGVEIGGATKNVVAIAAGMMEGLREGAAAAGAAAVRGGAGARADCADRGDRTGSSDRADVAVTSAASVPVPGMNARAALITRGLAEMRRLGVALGAEPGTFMGLSGIGDLVLTATSAQSRNWRVGHALGRGLTLDHALHTLGHVAEGVYSAQTVLARAQRLGVDMPITEAVVAVLQQRSTPAEAMRQLMERASRAEDA